jgi:hypothetical protein
MQRTITAWLVTVGLTLSFLPASEAAEERTWVTRKGGHHTAQLLRVDGANAVLITPELREVPVEIEDLSLVDRMYLVEYGGADSKYLNTTAKGRLSAAEQDARSPKGDFKRLDDEIAFGDNAKLTFKALQTDHFVVAGDMATTNVAEMAERLWHGMAFEHINFLEDWGSKRKLILLIEDDDLYAALGDWYKKRLENEKGEFMQEHARRTRALWDQVGSTSMLLTDKLTKYLDLDLFERALVFNVRDGSKSYGKVFGAFPTHSIASSLMSQQMGGISEYAEAGEFAISVGHAYYKEIQLAKETETMMIDIGDYENDDIVKSEGFEDGTSWAKTIRKLVRQGDVKPSLDGLFKFTGQNLTPEGVVLIYSFGYYLQSTPERLVSYANLVRRVEYGDAIPLPVEIAKLYGFKTADEFEADWIKFIKEGDFK